MFLARQCQAYRRLADRIGDGTAVRRRVLSSFADLTPTLRYAPRSVSQNSTLMSGCVPYVLSWPAPLNLSVALALFPLDALSLC